MLEFGTLCVGSTSNKNASVSIALSMGGFIVFFSCDLLKNNAFGCIFPVIGFVKVWFGRILFLGLLFVILPMVGKGWHIKMCELSCSSCVKKDKHGL